MAKMMRHHMVAAATVVATLLAAPQGVYALDNGFVKPALGWSSWYAAPMGSQVTDAFVRASAEALISSGLAAKGYKYLLRSASLDRNTGYKHSFQRIGCSLSFLRQHSVASEQVCECGRGLAACT